MPAIDCTIIEVCIVAYFNRRPRYLLLRRAKTESLYPGVWQLMSGMIEADETALAASLRELREETGLNPKKYWIVPHMNTFFDPHKNIAHHTVVFLALVDAVKKPILSSEHDAFEWCSKTRAKKILVWPGQIQIIDIVEEFLLDRTKKASALSEISL